MKTDVHLQRDVIDELDWEPTLDAAQIGVTVKEGLVTLTGHVGAYAEKHAAADAAKRVHGVRAVANEIEVRPPEAHVRDDETLAAAAIHVLQWDVMVPDEAIQVTVERGCITVEGTVPRQFQKVATDRALRHLTGVRGLTNLIVVAPQPTHEKLQHHIEAAFRRSATLNSKKLSVTVDGATVTLAGDVHSPVELEEAERNAWAAQGVVRVHNCITVTPWGTGPAEEWGY